MEQNGNVSTRTSDLKTTSSKSQPSVAQDPLAGELPPQIANVNYDVLDQCLKVLGDVSIGEYHQNKKFW